jgi:lysozyme
MDFPPEFYAGLTRDEGVRYVAYLDSRGFWTNGIGHKLTAAELGAMGAPLNLGPVSDDQVQQWLHADVATDCGPLAEFDWYNALDQVRQAVFANMAYNMGFHKLLGFPSMLHYASIGDWVNTAAQMRSSVWAEQVGARAVRLEEQVITGQWV